MSVVLKKDEADRLVFNHKPKALKIETTGVVKDFVSLAQGSDSGFVIADIVAKQSGVSALRKQQLEAQVEETVLVRLKEIEEQAYKQAYDLGMAEGREQAYNERSEVLQTGRIEFENALKNLDSLVTNMCKQHELLIMEMTFRIAERIVMREIAKDETLIRDVLNSVITNLQAAQRIKIMMSPDDIKYIEELRAKDPKQAELLERVKVEANPEIKRGGCLVETEFGTVDATIEQRVEKAWQAIESKLPVVTTADTSGEKK